MEKNVNFHLNRNNFNRGTGMNRDRRRPQFPTVSDFCDMLRHHGLFSFARARKEMQPQQIQSFVEATVEERNLFALAWEGGDDYMQVLANYMRSCLKDLMPKKDSVQEVALRMGQNWDDELKAFCARVENHDWFHSFSDDGDVSRRGRERYLELEKIAEEKGGLYQVILSQKAKAIGDHIRSGKTYEDKLPWE